MRGIEVHQYAHQGADAKTQGARQRRGGARRLREVAHEAGHGIGPHQTDMADEQHHGDDDAPQTPGLAPGVVDEQGPGAGQHRQAVLQHALGAHPLHQAAVDEGDHHHQQDVEAEQPAVVLGRHLEILDIDVGGAA